MASCPQVAVQVPRNVPAYSMVTAPDFYPNCDQRELVEWWLQRVPTALRNLVWQTPPLTLSDEHLAPNLQLPGVDFRAEDTSVTAIVSLPLVVVPQQRPLEVAPTRRHAHLPDTAAGIFAPGWDTSHDETNGVAHLAAYGLGSPFPEDAKLCAALSSFWPAVAPDSGRSFSRVFPTATPLTDEEIGSVGDLPWDGIPGPRRLDGDADVVEYAQFDFVDYVRTALDSRFTLALTGRVDALEYEARVLVAARSYIALDVPGRQRRVERASRFGPSTSAARTSSPRPKGRDRRDARRQPLPRRVRPPRLGAPAPTTTACCTSRRRAVTIFAGAESTLLVRRADGAWQAVQTA